MRAVAGENLAGQALLLYGIARRTGLPHAGRDAPVLRSVEVVPGMKA